MDKWIAAKIVEVFEEMLCHSLRLRPLLEIDLSFLKTYSDVVGQPRYHFVEVDLLIQVDWEQA